MIFCQLCGEENKENPATPHRGEPMTRIPFIARQGGHFTHTDMLKKPEINTGVEQQWESIYICIPCTKVLIENLSKSL